MYVKRLFESDHQVWEGNDIFEPVKVDMTSGLLLQCLRISRPCPLHSHGDIEQIYYIRSGRGVMTIDGEKKDVEPDMVVFIPAGAEHFMAPAEGETNLTYLSICHYHEVSSRKKTLGKE